MTIATVKYNERTWAIDIISYINSKLVSPGNLISHASGEYSVSVDGQTLFPDVLLFGGDDILQGWELKMPDTDIDNEELVKNAKSKAQVLGLNSFLLWNAKQARLYIYDDSENEYLETDEFSINNELINSREDVGNRKDLWQKDLETVIARLNEYFSTKKIKSITIQAVFSNTTIINQILSCHVEIRDFLISQSKKDKKLNAHINHWWKYVSHEYPGYKEPYLPLAYLIVLGWFNRFIFIYILKAYNKINIKDEEMDVNISVNKALDLFKTISQHNGSDTIVSNTGFDKYIPEHVWKKMVCIFYSMKNFEFGKISKNVLGEIIHSVVLTSIKKMAGLYATPAPLAELLVKLTINDKAGYVIDPFCGTGTIVKSIIEEKGNADIDGRMAARTTWGCDKFAFPVQVATLALSLPSVLDEPMRIFTHDAFDLYPGKKISFSNLASGKVKTEETPLFSAIVSNFPFVQFEDISELNHTVVIKIEAFYKKYNVDEKDRLSGKGDLFTYIPFLLYDLLDNDGYLGMIISNSWLSTMAGKKFCVLLRQFYDIDYIVISGAEKWFKNTDVVTNLVICRKKQLINKERTTSFVIVDKSIYDEHFDIGDVAEDILVGEHNSDYVSTNVYTESMLDRMLELNIGWNSGFGSIYWLINNIKKFVPVKEYAKIFRGERRGCDSFFYPSACDDIENDYLLPALKSSKSQNEYFAQADAKAFCCSISKDELVNKGHIGALKWIEKYENKRDGNGIIYSEKLDRSNLYWYQFVDDTEKHTPDFVTSINPDKRFFVQLVEGCNIVNQRLICVKLKERTDVEFFHALLNSTVCLAQLEALGFGRGLGALDINSTKISKGFYIPRKEMFTSKQKEDLINSFKKLTARSILDIDKELIQTDRRKLDKVVFNALKFNQKDIDGLYDGFLRMYQIRRAVKNDKY